MATILLYALCAVGIYILFCPYQICVSWERIALCDAVHVQIISWKHLFGFEWAKGKEASNFYGILFKKKKALMQKKTKEKKSHPSDKTTDTKSKKKGIEKKRIVCLARHLFFRIPEITKKWIRSFPIERLDVEAFVGAENPANTGLLYGCARVLNTCGAKNLRVDIYPDFFQTRLEGRATLVFRFILFKILWRALCTGVEAGLVYRKCRK